MVSSLPFSCFVVSLLVLAPNDTPGLLRRTVEVDWGTGRVSCSQPEAAI
ncbi:hypothetical protein COLO4_05822 [Corchorus olitorius]|uniref:Uncharacterized protein n=1 Tax=Corchorus olitorius TaxID=93759 RepID=A0A1R3KPX6_9ROSI|nr:hypothetical protein COLO4_05822 [Corchorus olitorius]